MNYDYEKTHDTRNGSSTGQEATPRFLGCEGTTKTVPRLVMIAPAPVIRTDNGFVLDAKFIEGIKQHAAQWPGELVCILREGAKHIPFGAREVQGIDGVDLRVLTADETVPETLLNKDDLLFCSADDARNLNLPARAKALGAKVVLAIEYTFETRLQIAWHDRARPLIKRLYSMLWLARQERRLRRAIRMTDGLQSNGYPAHALYGPMAKNALLYLDNRMTPDLFATEHDLHSKLQRLGKDTPLRLVFSGRLEPMKGAQDLIPIATLLRNREVAFTLDIFGDGSLSTDIASDIKQNGLSDVVRLHAPVDFETELVPWLRLNADIYLCCHRQSDPSCTYLENMGCGLAVAGFGNRMWSALKDASDAGWVVPMGDREELANTLAKAARTDIARCCENAARFAQAHDFVSEFTKRMEHLARVAQVEHVPAKQEIYPS